MCRLIKIVALPNQLQGYIAKYLNSTETECNENPETECNENPETECNDTYR